jgi:hypothetical protein
MKNFINNKNYDTPDKNLKNVSMTDVKYKLNDKNIENENFYDNNNFITES